jgi:hypothetical protein
VDSRNTVYASIDGVLFDKNIETIITYPMGKTARTYTIPSSVTSIGKRAFYECSNLTNITILSSVTDIGDSAFYGCRSLIIVTIPSSVTRIGERAFDSCSSLTSVTIPSSVMFIGNWAFSECSSLTSVTLSPRTFHVGWEAFPPSAQITYREEPTPAPMPVLDGLDYEIVNDRSVTITKYTGSAATLYIPAQIQGLPVTSIGERAFRNCSSLTSVTIPPSVTSIGDFAFLYCSSLTNITVDYRNPDYASVDGVLFDKGIQTIISYPAGKRIRTYTIPSSVMSIGDYAFYGCRILASVIIPSSVMSIGGWAFYDCSSLTSITIPSSVTFIGQGAFHSCSSLTNITIPSSVTFIGQGAFYNCSSLTSITLSRRTQVGEGAFTETVRITYRD